MCSMAVTGTRIAVSRSIRASKLAVVRCKSEVGTVAYVSRGIHVADGIIFGPSDKSQLMEYTKRSIEL
jgi:hypothetical protein